MKYLVSHQGQQSGPFTIAQIAMMLGARQLDALDFAFDEATQDWLLLTEIPGVTQILREAQKPARPAAPSPAATDAASVTPAPGGEWLVQKGDAHFGPFTHGEMIGLLQQKKLDAFDLCRSAGATAWARVGEQEQFSRASVRQMLARGADGFIARQSKRLSFATSIILNDQTRAWRAEARELSRGGLGLHSTQQSLVPGQTIHLHCASSALIPAFTAVCEVVAKTYVADGSPVQYGLRFLELGVDAQSSINAKVI